MNCNLNLYKYFYEVAYYGSYTKAAESLLISQPSLSYSVKVLENQLNKKLFVRGKKGINLTAYGKYLFDKLEVVFKELQSISNDDNNVSGTITLGVRSAFAYKVLPFYLGELSKIYPDLRVNFVVSSHDRLVTMLANNEVDLIIDEYIYGDDYTSYELEFNYENVFFTNKINNINEIVTIDTLKNSNICVVEPNRITKELEKKYPYFKYVKVQSTPIMINRVEKENMIGIAALVLINDDIEKGDLVRLETNIELPKLNMYIICKKNNKEKNVKEVINFFKVHFGNFEKALKDI